MNRRESKNSHDTKKLKGNRYGQQKMGKGIKTDSWLQIALNVDDCWAWRTIKGEESWEAVTVPELA